jgi:Flagellar hook-length control protein FliK
MKLFSFAISLIHTTNLCRATGQILPPFCVARVWPAEHEPFRVSLIHLFSLLCDGHRNWSPNLWVGPPFAFVCCGGPPPSMEPTSISSIPLSPASPLESTSAAKPGHVSFGTTSTANPESALALPSNCSNAPSFVGMVRTILQSYGSARENSAAQTNNAKKSEKPVTASASAIPNTKFAVGLPQIAFLSTPGVAVPATVALPILTPTTSSSSESQNASASPLITQAFLDETSAGPEPSSTTPNPLVDASQSGAIPNNFNTSDAKTLSPATWPGAVPILGEASGTSSNELAATVPSLSSAISYDAVFSSSLPAELSLTPGSNDAASAKIITGALAVQTANPTDFITTTTANLTKAKVVQVFSTGATQDSLASKAINTATAKPQPPLPRLAATAEPSGTDATPPLPAFVLTGASSSPTADPTVATAPSSLPGAAFSLAASNLKLNLPDHSATPAPDNPDPIAAPTITPAATNYNFAEDSASEHSSHGTPDSAISPSTNSPKAPSGTAFAPELNANSRADATPASDNAMPVSSAIVPQVGAHVTPPNNAAFSNNSPHDAAAPDLPTAPPAPDPSGPNHLVSEAQLAQSGGRSEMHIAMQSENLGSIELHARISGDSVGAAITVEKRDAHTALSADLPALQQALSDKQLRVEQITLLHAPLQATAGNAASQHFGGYSQSGGRQSSNFFQGAGSSAVGGTSAFGGFSLDTTEIFDAQGRLSVHA